jgi:hypothetical protein
MAPTPQKLVIFNIRAQAYPRFTTVQRMTDYEPSVARTLAPAQSAAESIEREFLAAPKRCSASYSGYCGPKVGLDGSRIVTVVGVLVAVREGKRANARERMLWCDRCFNQKGEDQSEGVGRL